MKGLFNAFLGKAMEETYKATHSSHTKRILRKQFGDEAAGTIGRFIDAGASMDDAIEAYRRLIDPPPVYGSARWATWEDAHQASLMSLPNGMHDNEVQQTKIIFGLKDEDGAPNNLPEQPEKVVAWDEEGHLLTVAPTRSGKGTMQVIPNLIGYSESVVVLDPKGENYEHTAGHRSRFSNVVKISPFDADTGSINPIDFVDDEDDARVLAELIFPFAASSGSVGAYWEQLAINYITALILHVKASAPEGRKNISEVRNLITLPDKPRQELFKHMAKSESPAIKRTISILATYKDLQTLMTTLDQKTAIWDSEGVARATKETTVDPLKLKEFCVSVYLVIPFEKMRPYQSFLRVMVGTIMSRLQKTQSRDKVLFLLDEFPALGQMNQIVDGLRYLAGYGVRVWMFTQDLASLKVEYGDRADIILSQTPVKSFFGTHDTNTLDYLSNALGSRTVASEGFSGGGVSVNYYGRPLASPDELRELLGVSNGEGTRRGIVFVPNCKPLCVFQSPWWVTGLDAVIKLPVNR